MRIAAAKLSRRRAAKIHRASGPDKGGATRWERRVCLGCRCRKTTAPVHLAVNGKVPVPPNPRDWTAWAYVQTKLAPIQLRCCKSNNNWQGKDNFQRDEPSNPRLIAPHERAVDQSGTRFAPVAQRAWSQGSCRGAGDRREHGDLGTLGKRDTVSLRRTPCRSLPVHWDSDSTLLLPKPQSLPIQPQKLKRLIYADGACLMIFEIRGAGMMKPNTWPSFFPWPE